MKLTELRPQFRQGEPEWGNTDDYAKAIAIEFDCPGCVGKSWSHRIWAPFLGRYPMNPDKTAQWSASGSGYHDLTFSDVPGHSRSIRCMGGCRSHFNVTSGAIDFYGDSGHQHYRETPMVDETKAAAAATEQAKADTNVAGSETNGAQSEAKASLPPKTAALPPPGYTYTSVLQYIEGKLHALFLHHDPAEPAVYVPIEGEHPVVPTVQLVEAYIQDHVGKAVAAFESRLLALEGKFSDQTGKTPDPKPAA